MKSPCCGKELVEIAQTTHAGHRACGWDDTLTRCKKCEFRWWVTFDYAEQRTEIVAFSEGDEE
jgi:hypothetical protein